MDDFTDDNDTDNEPLNTRQVIMEKSKEAAAIASRKLRRMLQQLAPWRSSGATKRKSKPEGEATLLGGQDKRVVFCNQPVLNDASSFGTNVTSTTKYNAVTFLPKALYEQFRRAGYWYFTVMAILSLTPVSPYSPISVVGPLVFVLAVALIREGIEDSARASSDSEVNAREVFIYRPDGVVIKRQWRDVRVGDIVRISEGDFFPADLLLLYSSGAGGVCYVETKNLDGETNLKVRQALDETSYIGGTDQAIHLEGFKAKVICEGPNASLYTFTGTAEIGDNTVSLGPLQLLLRDSCLQNTDYIVGAAIYTGFDTKVALNGSKPRTKRSRMDKKLDVIIWLLFFLLIALSLVSAAGLAILCYTQERWMYYVQPFVDDDYYNPDQPWTVFALALLTSVILYGYLIPLAMYVSLELIRIFQAQWMERDIKMFDDVNNKPAKAKTAGLNEELGQVNTILSDKTGTLTCNQMDFFRCTIGGISYGSGTTEVEKAAARLGLPLASLPSINPARALSLGLEFVEDDEDDSSNESGRSTMNYDKELGYNLQDDRLRNGKWVEQPNPELFRRFLEILALCHTAISEGSTEEGNLKYRAESPDEASFLVAAKKLGFVFHKRTPTALHVQELYPLSPGSLKRTNSKLLEENQPQNLEYELLAVLDFSSARKRMSVIVRDPKGKILLLSKGADVAIMARLVRATKGAPPGMDSFVDETARHMTKYGQAGLRTLTLAYREIEREEFKRWLEKHLEARGTVGPTREDKLEEVAEEIEKDLILVGGTGVEDKLQDGVSECIERLAQAGIHIWVLTGDKTDTAINIAYACSLLRAGMERVEVTLDSPEAKAAEEQALTSEGAEREEAEEALKTIVSEQLQVGRDFLEQYKSQGGSRKPVDEEESGKVSEGLALVVDGRSLAVILAYPDLSDPFINLCFACESILCCRVSPKQKALVTRLVRSKLRGRGLCLGIGDGANDVGMIQAADIGVGISGLEGAQAAMAADYSIGQFRFLERLLLVHGHWCYRRLAITINYSLFKVLAQGMLLFYSSAVTFWTGQTLIDQWYSSFFNTLFTAFPIAFIGVFDQDVSAEECIRFPQLYQQGQDDVHFNWIEISTWVLYGFYVSLVIFFVPIWYYTTASLGNGQLLGLEEVGTVMFSCLIWIANIVLFLTVAYFTWIHHALIWGSIAIWYLFLIIYNYLPVTISLAAYQVFVEVLAPSPSYWSIQLLATAIALLPFFVWKSYNSLFHPSDDEIIREVDRSTRPRRKFHLRFRKPRLPKFPSLSQILPSGSQQKLEA